MTAVLRNLSEARAAAPLPRAPSPERLDREQRLSATLVRLGKLNGEAVEKIAEIQRQTNAPFAKVASKLGLLTKEDVATALGVQNGFLRESEGEGRLPADAVIVRRPASREAEQFRAVRTRLLTSKAADKLNLFAIASIGSAREADYVALNMAASFAQLGRRTLIVDADLRGERLSSRFATAAGPGLKEALAGASDIRQAIRPSVIANLSLMTAGAPSANGHELLAGATLRPVFDYLRAAFEIVIVATAPFGPVVDAQFAWSATGAVFAVTRRHQDRAAEMVKLSAAIRSVDAETIGVILAG